MAITEHHERQKQLFLEACTTCGICAAQCPVIPHTNLRDMPAREIQAKVLDCIEKGIPHPTAYTKALACMECFKCTADMCPQGLNPLAINEIIKSEAIAEGRAPSIFIDSRPEDSPHRVLSGIQTSGEEYERISRASQKRRAKHVFFPGCNVYFQPEKILNALDILDMLGEDYAFLPGLDYCCGDNGLFSGDISRGSRDAEELIAAIMEYEPESVLLWCPTCLCRFDKTIAPSHALPFDVLSFPRYLSEHMDTLPLTDSVSGTVTLHEACKSAYTGLDLQGPRDVLSQLPGVKLVDMEHCGSQAVCCGSGAVAWFPESSDRIRDSRLREAAETGAERLVTVCHYCSQTFAAEEARYDFQVTNYVILVAGALGIQREDTFRQYRLWGDVERILEDRKERISELSFEKERVLKVLKSVFAAEGL